MRRTLRLIGMRTIGAGAVLSALAVAFAAPSPLPAGAAAAGDPPSGSVTVSPTAGPIGTVVHVQGQLAAACRPSSGTVSLTFERAGQSTVGGVESVWSRVLSGGSVNVAFRVPTTVGGSATRGLYAYPVSSGTYQFRFSTGGTCGQSTAGTFQVTGPPAPSAGTFVAMAPTPDGKGYWLAQAGGGVFSFGDAGFYGSLPAIHVQPAQPIVGIAATPDGKGYWLVGADGGVYAFGDATFDGSVPGAHIRPNAPVVAVAATSDGKGYWLLGADGGVYAFGDATYQGRQTTALAPFEAIGALDGGGYALAASHPGAVWDEPSGAKVSTEPTTADFPLAATLSGEATTATGKGAWQVGLDGGVFAFGSAHFYGSLPGIGVSPNAPVVAITRTPDDNGYWLLGADGGVFAFGAAGFFGSAS